MSKKGLITDLEKRYFRPTNVGKGKLSQVKEKLAAAGCAKGYGPVYFEKEGEPQIERKKGGRGVFIRHLHSSTGGRLADHRGTPKRKTALGNGIRLNAQDQTMRRNGGGGDEKECEGEEGGGHKSDSAKKTWHRVFPGVCLY